MNLVRFQVFTGPSEHGAGGKRWWSRRSDCGVSREISRRGVRCRCAVRSMRKPRAQRDNFKARVVQPPPLDVDLDDVALRAEYVSSPYHSSAARIRRPRPDASQCPSELSSDLDRVQAWLREAIRLGWTGAWDGGFPRYVWRRFGGTIFEARQGSPGSGQYHGYPLEPEQHVRGLP